jgi:hypothetical protein
MTSSAQARQPRFETLGYAELEMTYNFDPDRWYENQRRLLDARRAAGEIDQDTLGKLLEDLETRYDEMCRRQDRPFELPDHHDKA